MQGSVGYNLIFASAVCVVCAVFVSSSAVLLKERQDYNAAIDKQRNVLVVSGLASDDDDLTADEVEQRFTNIRQIVIDLATGDAVPDVDPLTYDQRRATTDPALSHAAPSNAAQVLRVPNRAIVYEVRDDQDRAQLYVLPVEGKGLWSTLYGFIALDVSLETVQGLTFYEHGETPGLGGEVDNPRWKASWRGRRPFDDAFEPDLTVIKGRAGPPADDPHRVDGLSGATMTSRGVAYLIEFWLGDDGFGPYLDRLRAEGADS
ncbi:MAG: Na(+)-translocating NADH-quinone reductase subunit C [Vicinamibacterales bacterium]|jgi:Na+-transporting NADH:ubiquinone oxidoreductase subunit C|nr:Na(+)-translocating NADH-quinone reductase subunit C [Acidobacteriota bacterium]MDP6373142.1 Na(+)-translocating NADH-quinone reductase subunit C [Vicinamibacterales bacterium]MDP6607890.1 Na(+)-translocating NADH-quinone reductase subunit C [Vicinamibacterales bacterium]HAK56465.1 Na(+)-translocating NADH-quinone reductase subunit C [Acidobacteriota bacterium]|tara:strand:+ start:5670 stop:6452 length:783 start_codon:yes stop_codon:yes gene_type:complete